MQTLGTFQRRTFLNSHPPIQKRVLISSTGKELDILAGAVLGEKEDTIQEYTKEYEAKYILAEDITVPAAGNAYALVYVHAHVVPNQLIWADGVSADEQNKAIAELHGNGIYASEV